MSNEKKIEIPAMPEKYRIMLEMLPEEPAGSKEEQAMRWKLRSTILEAYSAELRGKDVGGGVAILALLTGIMTEEAKSRGTKSPSRTRRRRQTRPRASASTRRACGSSRPRMQNRGSAGESCWTPNANGAT